MRVSHFDLWVDGAYFPQRDKMGGGYVVVEPSGIRLTQSFRLSVEGYPACMTAAKYMSAIKALQAQPQDELFDFYCDNQQIVDDINMAAVENILPVKNKMLRSLLRQAARECVVKAYHAPDRHRFIVEAYDLAQLGALSPKR